MKKRHLLFLGLAVLCCLNVRGAATDYDKISAEIKRLDNEIAELRRQHNELDKEYSGIRKGKMTFRYPIGMSAKAAECEKKKIEDRKKEIEKIAEQKGKEKNALAELIKGRKVEIVEIEIEDKGREGKPEFWELSLILNKTRIHDAPRKNRICVTKDDISKDKNFNNRVSYLTFKDEVNLTVTDWTTPPPQPWYKFGKQGKVESFLFTKTIRTRDIKMNEYHDEFTAGGGQWHLRVRFRECDCSACNTLLPGAALRGTAG